MNKNYYCGAKWFPRWLRKLLSKHFNKSCELHDAKYQVWNNSRANIDKEFYNDMVAESPHKPKLAKTYYIIVRALGWTRFKG